MLFKMRGTNLLKSTECETTSADPAAFKLLFWKNYLLKCQGWYWKALKFQDNEFVIKSLWGIYALNAELLLKLLLKQLFVSQG